MRIACVQNGDFTSALRNFRAGAAETYNGQFYTVDAFNQFVAGQPHIVVSLDSPPHEQRIGSGILAAIAPPHPPVRLPRRILLRWHAKQIIRRLEEFGATHLLIRCVDIIGCELLAWANSHDIPSASIIAARFDRASAVCRRYCRLAGAPGVQFVANHNRVATQSLIDCGLDPVKAIAWDLPPTATPSDYPAKKRKPGRSLSLLFAGVLRPTKGVLDIVAAAARSREQGIDVRLAVCGDGELLDTVRRHAGVSAGWLEAPGRLGQDEVLRRMAASDLVIVPSHTAFPEGLPFVIQEALAVRTPLLLSDHPVFVRYFQDGQAVHFFRQADVESLAGVIHKIATDAPAYARLSEQTLSAWESLQCPMKFHHLLARLSADWADRPSLASTAAMAV